MDFIEDLIITTTIDDEIIDLNNAFLNILQKNIDEIIGKKQSEILIQLESSEDKSTQTYEETLEINSNKYYYQTKKELITQNKTKKILITRRDITNYKQYLTLYNENKNLLKLIAKGKSTKLILNEIIKSVESKSPHIICSILLLDDSGQKLIKGAAPSLPDFYNDKISGMQIGEKVGSCGAAVFLKTRVIVEDISTHENWKYAKKLAARANLHACWSQPIFSSSNKILGSFAIYYDKPKKPTKYDLDLIEDIASIAGIALEKRNDKLKQKKAEEERQKQDLLLMHKSKQAMMGEMLENIAHQWRQPLSVISTCATGLLVEKELGINTEMTEIKAFEAINLNAQYLSNTIDDFREYFMYNGKIVDFELGDCIEHVKKLFNIRFKNNDINFITTIKKIKLSNYENEFMQVLMNIFSNSIEVLKNVKKSERFIFVDIYNKNGNAIIKIIDSGRGASLDIVQRLFEPYFTTKHKKQGTGIGLYMCKEIIEKHMRGTISSKNNNITYNDKLYYGLEFEIKIPLL